MVTKYPTREAQDLIATRIRAARIFARFAVVEAGGAGAAAYLAALQASVAPPKHSPARNGKPAGSVFRGCASRPAAGLRTFDALDFLGRGLAAEAAALDLDCDPGCIALHAARDALIGVLAEGKACAADLDARDACRDYDREVGLGVAALWKVVEDVVRSHRATRGTGGLTLDDALGCGMDGLYTALTRYQHGTVSLVSYCMWGRPGAQYICKAVIAASRQGAMRDEVSDHEYANQIHRGDVVDGRVAIPDYVPVGPSFEEEVIAAEILRDRERLAASVIAAGAAAQEAKAAATGKETSTVRGVRALAHHHTPPPKDFGTAAKYLRGIYRQAFAVGTCKPALPH